MNEKRIIYTKKDAAGQQYFCWSKEDNGGYYNLIAMLRLKNLNLKDICTEEADIIPQN